jgi:hypothetical protein
MKKKLSYFIWEGFRQAQGVLSTIGAIIIAFLFWQFTPNTNLPLYIIMPSWIILILIIMALIFSLLYLYGSNNPSLPKVVYSRSSSNRTGNGNQNTTIDCLLEPSDLYSYDSYVSFYFKDPSGFEQDIGLGCVTNIQDDKKIKATLLYPHTGQDDVIDKLRNNDSSIQKCVIVKPVVSKAYKNLINE